MRVVWNRLDLYCRATQTGIPFKEMRGSEQGAHSAAVRLAHATATP